ncbi:unnamed protein product [Onchocerca ochengi]|uniref:SXP/RAL-2 family protein Ani s 5-like cation-binding domain-containing protein n=1 Tax=Onchocerca ochengi TaxID=42157 RepID=A0A182EVU6_ONCOC|nr:unnamed protein product [Onchocerca ochengi]VDM98555.1 unnamed protein product [Onchocerca ochengi]
MRFIILFILSILLIIYTVHGDEHSIIPSFLLGESEQTIRELMELLAKFVNKPDFEVKEAIEKWVNEKGGMIKEKYEQFKASMEIINKMAGLLHVENVSTKAKKVDRDVPYIEDDEMLSVEKENKFEIYLKSLSSKIKDE